MCVSYDIYQYQYVTKSVYFLGRATDQFIMYSSNQGCWLTTEQVGTVFGTML